MACDVLGLIAGQGSFPLEIARAARRRGIRVAALAFHGETAPALEDTVERAHWLHPGEVGAAIAFLRAEGVSEAVMAGKVPKTNLLAAPETLRLDEQGRRIVDALRAPGGGGDHAILRAVAAHLESQGIALRDQTHFCPELLAGFGALGRVSLPEEAAADVAFGARLARSLAAHDVGQTVVVKDGAVLSVEAIEGTDAAIRRGGTFAPGGRVVKVARSDQDPRFDLPAIGPETVAALVDARASVLAVEAQRCVVLEREATLKAADAHQIAVVGISGEVAGAAP